MDYNIRNENCTFCQILNSSATEYFYKDDQFVAFKDIKPATSHHYLVIPRKHLKNASSLEPKDILLIKKMVEIGKIILENQSASLPEARFGFHWPPFTSMDHLHLHVISPVNEMGFVNRLIFRPDSYWFINASTLIKHLEKKEGLEKEKSF